MTAYRPPKYPWVRGAQVVNLGVGGPRTNMEAQGSDVRVWPTIYQVPARGIGNMPLFQLGVTAPVFDNRLAGGSPGYNTMLPGMGKSPFAGGGA